MSDRDFPLLLVGLPHRDHDLVSDFWRRRRELLAGRRNPRLRGAKIAELGNAKARIDRAARPHRALARIFGPVP